MSIQTINITDTPNQGRVKINSNFDSVVVDLNNKLNIDGSNSMVGHLDMGGYRTVNAGAGVDDDDYITKAQMITETNHLVVKRYIYCNPDYNQTSKILYLDGTNSDFGVKVDNLSTALAYANAQADGTLGLEWVIKVPFKTDYWTNQSFVNFSDYINIIGEGKPIIEISDGTTSGVADIIGNSKIRDSVLVYKDGKILNISGNATLENCDIILNNTSGFLPRKVVIAGGNILRCRIIADVIELDGTTGNYVDECTISIEDFTNPENNEINVTNKSVLNLENYLETYSTI
jgi:hypothetical protein